MKSSFSDQQRFIQAQSNVLQIMQFARDILKDNEQYILRTTI